MVLIKALEQRGATILDEAAQWAGTNRLHTAMPGIFLNAGHLHFSERPIRLRSSTTTAYQRSIPLPTITSEEPMPRPRFEFIPGECYHIYNRGCDRRPIFFEIDNYLFFLRELKVRTRAAAVDVLAWCLMPNH